MNYLIDDPNDPYHIPVRATHEFVIEADNGESAIAEAKEDMITAIDRDDWEVEFGDDYIRCDHKWDEYVRSQVFYNFEAEEIPER